MFQQLDGYSSHAGSSQIGSKTQRVHNYNGEYNRSRITMGFLNEAAQQVGEGSFGSLMMRDRRGLLSV